jgi:hypothetical protein
LSSGSRSTTDRDTFEVSLLPRPSNYCPVILTSGGMALLRRPLGKKKH